MSFSFFNRTKEKDDSDLGNPTVQEEEMTPLKQDPEQPSSSSQNEDDDVESNKKVFTTPTKFEQLANRVKNMGTFNILLISNVICFFIFIIALPAHEKAKHYKAVQSTISDITNKVKQRTDDLTEQKQQLTNTINDESATLIEKMHHLLGVVSSEHHQKEIGEKDTNIKIKQSEIDKMQIEIDKSKRSIEQHKSDLLDVKSKLGKTQSLVDNFCDYCAFTTDKVITNCYRKMQFILKYSPHLTTEYEAKAAVIELDPKCSRKQDNY